METTTRSVEEVICILGIIAILFGALVFGGMLIEKQDNTYREFKKKVEYCKMYNAVGCSEILERDRTGSYYSGL